MQREEMMRIQHKHRYLLTALIAILVTALACGAPGAPPEPTFDPSAPGTVDGDEQLPPTATTAPDPTSGDTGGASGNSTDSGSDSGDSGDTTTDGGTSDTGSTDSGTSSGGDGASPTEPIPDENAVWRGDCIDDADFVRDVTLPDYTEVEMGETVTKTWELRNSGTCTWDSGYHLILSETSEGMTSLASTVPLPPTNPGQTTQLSVNLRLGTGLTPGDLERANFEIRNPDNVKFGVTPYGLVTVAGGGGGATGTLSGIVWLDYCSPPQGGGDPDGECVFDAINGYEGDGIRQPDEDGLADITISLHSDSCSGAKLEETVTNASGAYQFTNIAAARYCVLLDPLSADNSGYLIPGGSTYPRRGESIPSYILELAAGASRTDLDFGWDFQFD